MNCCVKKQAILDMAKYWIDNKLAMFMYDNWNTPINVKFSVYRFEVFDEYDEKNILSKVADLASNNVMFEQEIIILPIKTFAEDEYGTQFIPSKRFVFSNSENTLREIYKKNKVIFERMATTLNYIATCSNEVGDDIYRHGIDNMKRLTTEFEKELSIEYAKSMNFKKEILRIDPIFENLEAFCLSGDATKHFAPIKKVEYKWVCSWKL